MTADGGWLVLGAGGRIGGALCSALREAGRPLLAPPRRELDVTDHDAVTRFLRRHRPGIVANCAAWTAVDEAEHHEEEAMLLNGIAPRRLARGCAAVGSRLLHLSTDYVFSAAAGSRPPAGALPSAVGTGPHRPHHECDPPAALNAYGRTKLAGERAVLEELPHLGTVVRTAWVYGRRGGSFVRTMLDRAAGTGPVAVVADQYGQPTRADDVVRALLTLAAAPPSRTTGAFHATGIGSTSWYGLAREVFRLSGADPDRVVAVDTASRGGAAPRPLFSVLGHERWRELGAAPLRPWAEALAEFCQQELSAPCVR
ncbi:dTDP-4-dehydrorhamnose reductase [Streptomyces sp. NPDC048392]|uniref:dTDP-4-dehydrorhamnose reductase n=1 Tax=Streptomyces sp. NPDC048392 TaxID=3365543 RepID=UPI003715D069